MIEGKAEITRGLGFKEKRERERKGMIKSIKGIKKPGENIRGNYCSPGR